MNRQVLRVVVVASTLALGSGLPPDMAADRGGYFDLTLGAGMVDSPSGTVDLEAHSALGLHVAWTREGWPVHLVVSGTFSDEDDDPYAPYPREGDVVTAVELAAGIRKYWALERVRPFVGVGALLFLADRRLDGVLDEDEDLGTWIEAGLVWTIRDWHLGLSARVSDASVRLLGEEIEGGTSFHLVWGVHW